MIENIDLVAIYASVVVTVALVWNILRLRSRISAKVWIVEDILNIIVINKAANPITIRDVGLKMSITYYLTAHSPNYPRSGLENKLSCTIKSHDSANFYISMESIAKSIPYAKEFTKEFAKKSELEIKYIYIKDATEKTHLIKISNAIQYQLNKLIT